MNEMDWVETMSKMFNDKLSEIDEKFDRKLDRMTDNIDRMQRQIDNNTSFTTMYLNPNLLWLHLFLQS